MNLQKKLDIEYKAGKKFVVNWYNAITHHLKKNGKCNKYRKRRKKL